MSYKKDYGCVNEVSKEKSPEERIRYKSNAAWIVGLSWVALSAAILYLFSPGITMSSFCIIFGLVAFAIYISVGFALKAPTILIRNFLVYPFAIPVAQIANLISPRWTYDPNMNPLAFALVYMTTLMVLYMLTSGVSSFILKFATGVETYFQEPIASFSYSGRSGKADMVSVMRDFLGIFKDLSAKLVKEKNVTWIRFYYSLNTYAIAIVSVDHNQEVNIFACSLRNDVLCSPFQEELEVTTSMLDAYLTTKKEQGYLDDWKVEAASKDTEALKATFFRTLTSASETRLKAFSFGQIRRDVIRWLKANKKTVIGYALVAIVAPLIVGLLLRLFG